MSALEIAHQQPLADRRLYLSLWSLLSGAALAQASLQPLAGALGSTLFWAVVFGAGLAVGATQDPEASLPKQLNQGAAALGMLAFLLALPHGLARALLLLLLWLQAAQNFRLHTRRDAYFALAISFVAVLFASGHSKSGWFLVWLALYALAAVYTLVLLHAQACRARAAGIAADTRALLPPANVLALTTAVLLTAGTIYLFMPRPPAAKLGAYMDAGGHDYFDSKWEREADTESEKDAGDDENDTNRQDLSEPSGDAETDRPPARRDEQYDYSGFEEDFRIDQTSSGRTGTKSGGARGTSNDILLYVQAPQPLYLTGRVFDTFDGLHWSRRSRAERKRRLERGRLALDPAPLAPEPIKQVVEVATSIAQPSLFAASQAVDLGFPGSVVGVDRYGALRIPRGLEAGTVYQVSSRFRRVEGHLAHDSSPPKDAAAYLQLPDGQDPRIAQLAERVTAAAATPFDAALELENHLRTQYAYTLDTLASQNTTPLAEFLFETRRGHCEFFASAMAVMLRTRGIPSRLVTGFAATNLNPMTGYYEVRVLDGHAWVEAWFPDHGWVLFEPTAYYDLPRPEPSAALTARQLERYIDNLARQTELLSPETDGGWPSLAETLRLIKDAVVHGFTRLSEAAMKFAEEAGPYLAGLVILGLLIRFGWHTVATPIRDRLALRRVQAARRSDPQRFARVCYGETERWLARRGFPRDPAQTEEEYRAQVARHWEPAGDALRRLIRVFQKARYGTGPLQAREAEACFSDFMAITTLVTPAGRAKVRSN
ncbi:transglutaminase domain protein [Methylocaldum marinum]|uniref:Transglutaminase domain protein n=1 Tax=Methylocaldum marinum TaxID=1432792 RepID=A0A250L1N9_9GAMM|nr:transglutaminaseTgpA domain-containing protein [Methylocaldum marinum]BBA36169.1 transglutaminase domain protein [Methylocaldum marinum]